ncbi:MAG: VOC family protein [Bacteroidota bacterium]
MTTVNIYLTYNGNCREAFEFYKTVFKKEFAMINTLGEMPPQDGMPPIPEEAKDRIMHVTLPISAETRLMGSDNLPSQADQLVVGNNFSISVDPKDEKETERLFNALKEGGTVTMPLRKTFWNAYFGMLTDKYGIQWMLNCTLTE